MRSLRNLLKGAAGTVAALVVLVLWGGGCYRDLVDPYRWDNAPRAHARETGWELAVDNKAGDLVLPWTWFNPPTFSMAFVRPGSLYRASASSDTVFAPVLWVRREDTGKVIEELEFQAFDCKRQRFTLVADLSQAPENANLHGLTAQPLPGPWLEMSAPISRYFCAVRATS